MRSLQKCRSHCATPGRCDRSGDVLLDCVSRARGEPFLETVMQEENKEPQVCLECLRYVDADRVHPCAERCVEHYRADDDGMTQNG